MFLLFQILIAWLLADLLTGFVHWFEDKYLDAENTNFLASVAAENDLHHKVPTAMCASSGWTNMKSAAAIGWPVAFVFWLVGCPLVICLIPFFASFGNLVHRWSHMPRRLLPRPIRGMQEFGLFISPAHHNDHHRSMKKLIPRHLAGYKFCPMTDWVNPILDRLRFWRGIEWTLSKCGLQTTAQRKAETETENNSAAGAD